MPKKRGTSPRTARTPKTKRQPRVESDAGRGTPVKKARTVTRRRPVVSADDDVFIPAAPRSGVAPYTKTLKDADADDDDVFVAAPGVAVSPEWVDDTGMSNTEFWSRVDSVVKVAGPPRAGAASGWSPAELREHGLEQVGNNRVRCRYKCSGTTANVVGIAHHAYNCPFWTREGSDITPF